MMTPRRLTPTQERVAKLIASGRSYAFVGLALNIQPSTVKAHVHAIALKLDNPHDLPAKRLVSAHFKQAA